jgi:hypothetical protein
MSDPVETGLPQTGTKMSAAEFYELPETNLPIQLLGGRSS